VLTVPFKLLPLLPQLVAAPLQFAW